MPTEGLKFSYADEWATLVCATKWIQAEEEISLTGMGLKAFFNRWYLRMNVWKIVATPFQLCNREAKGELNVVVEGRVLPI